VGDTSLPAVFSYVSSSLDIPQQSRVAIRGISLAPIAMLGRLTTEAACARVDYRGRTRARGQLVSHLFCKDSL
jgi:hypothetical protein